MMNVFLFFLNASFCALNVMFYVAVGKPFSLAMAILSGFVALAVLAMEVRP